jgi:hypothetical protein
MPAYESKSKATATSTTLNQQNPDLIHIGAVHDAALNGKPHLHSKGISTELIHLDLTTTRVRKSGTSAANNSLFSATNGNVNAPPQNRAKGAPGFVPAWRGQNPPSDGSVEKNPVQISRAESASDQPWNALKLQGRSDAYGVVEKK